MPWTDPPLAQSYREAMARRAGDRGRCPRPETIVRLAAGELAGEERDELVDHLTVCSICSSETRIAQSLGAWAEEVAPGSERVVRPGAPSGSLARKGAVWWRWAFAAAVLLVALATPRLFQKEAPPSSTTREGGADAIRSLVPEDESLPRDRLVIRWSPGPPGSTYRLHVANDDLQVLYRARDLRAAEHQVPASALEGVPSGARLLWQIEVTDLDGRRTTSESFFVHVE